MGIIVRDIRDKEMTVYNPDGSPLVVTHNMLCVNDILIQIREQGLEGYKFQMEGYSMRGITHKGHIKFGVRSVHAEQLAFLMGLKDVVDDKEQRKKLESENTEFDYGHDVKHFSED